MHLDLRRPTLVVAGAFNPAIFTPGWIAAVAYGIPEGDEVEGTMVANTGDQTVRPYIREVGVLAEPNRLSIAVDRMEAECLRNAEQILTTIAETLSHTPTNGFGVNFHFITTDFPVETIDAFKPREDFSDFGVSRNFRTRSEIKMDDCQLNFRRSLTGKELEFDFNYHFNIQHMSEVRDLADGARAIALFQRTKDILERVYGLDIDDLEFIRALAGRG